MIKLRDLILVSYSNITIMDGVFETIGFSPCSVEKLKIINPDILECEVERLDANRNVIRVWLKEEKEWLIIKKLLEMFMLR